MAQLEKVAFCVEGFQEEVGGVTEHSVFRCYRLVVEVAFSLPRYGVRI